MPDFGAIIEGSGSGVPEKRLTNDDLSKMVETNDEWIVQRTGITRRFFALLPRLQAVGLGPFLIVSAVLLVLGVFGIFLNRKNVIILMMSIELILLAGNLNLVAFSAAHGELSGQVFTLFSLTVAAAEAAIGLAIVVVAFRRAPHVDVDEIALLKG